MSNFFERYEFSSEHLEFLKREYPVGSIIESPTGQRGEIFCYTHDGFLISPNGDVDAITVEIPFKKIGHYKIIMEV